MLGGMFSCPRCASPRTRPAASQSRPDRRRALARLRRQSLSDTFETDVYDELLTQAEIQGHVGAANWTAALELLRSALDGGDCGHLLAALRTPCLGLQVSRHGQRAVPTRPTLPSRYHTSHPPP